MYLYPKLCPLYTKVNNSVKYFHCKEFINLTKYNFFVFCMLSSIRTWVIMACHNIPSSVGFSNMSIFTVLFPTLSSTYTSMLGKLLTVTYCLSCRQNILCMSNFPNLLSSLHVLQISTLSFHSQFKCHFFLYELLLIRFIYAYPSSAYVYVTNNQSNNYIVTS